MGELLTVRPEGLYCAAGDFFVDPWQPVERAVLTHAHADHATGVARTAWASEPSLPLLRHRLGAEASIEGLAHGASLTLGDARVSLHPAGHILGSAQVRIEVGGEVWVVSGDYKRQRDPTCAGFEPVRCDTFVTEATFGLPVYQWEPTEYVVESIFRWWQEARAKRRPAVLFCYALGKAQRLLAELRRHTDAKVFVHGAIEAFVALYRAQGIELLPTIPVAEREKGHAFAGELVLAPVSARGTPWMRRFKDAATAFASGWMQLRGTRRRKGYERGFALSDHADWPALLETIESTGARRVLVMQGATHALARYLREVKGLDAEVMETKYEGERED